MLFKLNVLNDLCSLQMNNVLTGNMESAVIWTVASVRILMYVRRLSVTAQMDVRMGLSEQPVHLLI